MKSMGLLALVVVVLVAAGCSSPSRRGEPAPVEDAGVGPASAARSSREEPKPETRGESARPDSVEAEAPVGGVIPGPAPGPGPTQGSVSRPVPGKYGTAVASLVVEADGLRESGEFNRAAASLERALRIEPSNPYLWNRLARLRLEQGRLGEAADFAAKSNALAGEAAELKKDNWRMIALARRSAGDLTGARAAERKAEGLP